MIGWLLFTAAWLAIGGYMGYVTLATAKKQHLECPPGWFVIVTCLVAGPPLAVVCGVALVARGIAFLRK